MKRLLSFALVAIALLIVAPPSQGSTIFNLTQGACTGGCGTASPFGWVSLDQIGSTVSVTVTLAANEWFVGSGAGQALEFNLSPSAGTPVIISSITPSASFALGPAPATASAFGSFQYSVTCTACQGGNAGNPAGPLSFLVSTPNGVNVSNFIANGGGYFFASDIMGNTGNTGNVAALGPTVATPEPVSSALVAAGLLGIGFLGKRRSSKPL